VSSTKQKDDLERQCNYLRLIYPKHRLITDIGSGINWHRKGFKTILELADEKAIGEVVVASRDRLCRFAFELVENVLRRKDVQITVIDTEDTSPEQELSDDLLSIVQIFCCRRNGKRRYEVKAIDTDEENKTEPDNETKTST
jgi:predicted site-specific integrase-resolvase